MTSFCHSMLGFKDIVFCLVIGYDIGNPLKFSMDEIIFRNPRWKYATGARVCIAFYLCFKLILSFIFWETVCQTRSTLLIINPYSSMSVYLSTHSLSSSVIPDLRRILTVHYETWYNLVSLKP